MIKEITKKSNEAFMSALGHAVDYDFDHTDVNDFYLLLFNFNIHILDSHRKSDDTSN